LPSRRRRRRLHGDASRMTFGACCSPHGSRRITHFHAFMLAVVCWPDQTHVASLQQRTQALRSRIWKQNCPFRRWNFSHVLSSTRHCAVFASSSSADAQALDRRGRVVTCEGKEEYSARSYSSHVYQLNLIRCNRIRIRR
jgi:hypothetical protein